MKKILNWIDFKLITIGIVCLIAGWIGTAFVMLHTTDPTEIMLPGWFAGMFYMGWASKFEKGNGE
jgi:hypothetical protein